MIDHIEASSIISTLRSQLESINFTVETRESSTVTQVGDGIARVAGLQSAMSGELLRFTSSATGKSVYGLAQNLEEGEIGAVLFGDVNTIKEGDECITTGRVMDIPVGREMLGRVVNPLGQPIDGKGPIHTTHHRPIEFKAPGIIDRQPVCEPVQTGLVAIDAMVPIGRGQRELIIGDRKTGKTAIAIDTIINQRDTDIVCIYVAIGQKASTVAGIRETLSRHGVLDKTVIVSATASDSAPMQYIAPMAGAAIGEYFMYNDKDGNPADATHPGGHVLVVYDDLSKQAVAYRQMSLTLHRPPGREAYPGDIFYLHSRLLERAVKMSDENGGGSMTALPIIETQEGDVSAYIPTNVISITDGQIYLQSNLFFQGQRPAVDTGLSVSRVGGAAQLASMKQVAGTLRLDLASYREMQAFAQFGSDLDAATQHQLTHGSRMTEALKQGRFAALDVADQAIVLFAGKEGYLDKLAIEQVLPFRAELVSRLQDSGFDALRKSVREGKIAGDVETALRKLIGEVQAKFLPRDGRDVDAGALEAAAATAHSSDARIAAKVGEQSATTEADATTPHH
ncbi:MAG: F0F1 ATP synthase subunit alpha [Atopobiaceae bacterium]|nr:F0F1 ATP synthase subunit alpha [Atopobiaceae bacterium]